MNLFRMFFKILLRPESDYSSPPPEREIGPADKGPADPDMIYMAEANRIAQRDIERNTQYGGK